MYKLVFYVPASHLDTVKEAIFLTGAGKIGHYQQCCWQTLGRGQFCPQDQATPYLGEAGKLEQLDEFKVELVCEDPLIRAAVAALKQAHPYEEPAYQVLKVEAF